MAAWMAAAKAVRLDCSKAGSSAGCWAERKVRQRAAWSAGCWAASMGCPRAAMSAASWVAYWVDRKAGNSGRETAANWVVGKAGVTEFRTADWMAERWAASLEHKTVAPSAACSAATTAMQRVVMTADDLADR